MDRMNMMCPQCGAAMDYDPATAILRCPHCGVRMLVDDGRVRVDGESFEDAGYRFEQGRMQAQREAAQEAERLRLAREAAYLREQKRRKWDNLFCLLLTLILPFTSFLPKGIALSMAGAAVIWSMFDRRIAGVVKVMAWIFALITIGIRMVIG